MAVPQVVAQARTEGTLDYMRSLPIPRMVYLLADLTVQAAIVVPGVIFGVAVATIRFDLPVAPSPFVVPAVLLVVMTASCVGYAMASVLPPMLAQLMTQVLVVLVFMFSPLNFPPDRLPGWLAALHAVLPIQAMGQVLRGSLAPDAFPLPVGPVLLLAVWCAASFLLTFAVLNRRA